MPQCEPRLDATSLRMPYVGMAGSRQTGGCCLQMRESVDEQEAVVRYLCMPGSPYTGSTLLGFLLNSHPDCVSIGAATGLTARVDITDYRCSCGTRFEDCEFWKQVTSRTEELGYPVSVFETDFWNTHVRMSRRRWLNGLLVRSLGNDQLTDVRDAVLWRLSPIRRTVAMPRSTSTPGSQQCRRKLLRGRSFPRA